MHVAVVRILVLSSLVAAPAVGLDGAVSPPTTAAGIVERMRAAPVELELTDPELIDALPPSAMRSMVPERVYRMPVGIGTEGATRAASGRLVRVEAARVSVVFVAAGLAVQAGYSGSGAGRAPWLVVATPDGGGVPTQARPVLAAGDAVQGLVLREVVAIDADRIYLRAERDGAAMLVAGSVRFDRARPRVTRPRAAGPRD